VSDPDARLDDLYRDVVLDHYRTPRGRSPLPDPDVSNDGRNPLCGDEVTVSLKLTGGKTMERLHVHGRGCSISVASGSMMAEVLAGKPRSEAERIVEAFFGLMHGKPAPPDLDLGDLDALEGVRKFPVRIKCALLPWTTLRDALAAYDQGRAPDAPSTTEAPGGQT
jgi:nitrogen fixation NifU-like protein